MSKNPKKNVPSHIVYQVQDGKEDKSYWHRVGAACPKEHARTAIGNELAMAADIRSDECPSLRHRFERLQRCDELCQPDRAARVGENIDEIVVALHVVVRNAAGKDDAVGHP